MNFASVHLAADWLRFIWFISWFILFLVFVRLKPKVYFVFGVCYAEAKASETRPFSNSLGKRRQNVDEVVASKHSALHSTNSTPIVAGSERVYPTTTTSMGMSQPMMRESRATSMGMSQPMMRESQATSMGMSQPMMRESQATSMGMSQPMMRESRAVNDISYNRETICWSESSQPHSSEPSQSDLVSDWSAPSQMVPAALIASVPHMFQLIHTQTGATESASSVHPLLSMVQQAIPPLHDYMPLVPLTHAPYQSQSSPSQSQSSPSQSQHAVQSSHHALDQLTSSSSNTQPVSGLTSSDMFGRKYCLLFYVIIFIVFFIHIPPMYCMLCTFCMTLRYINNRWLNK